MISEDRKDGYWLCASYGFTVLIGVGSLIGGLAADSDPWTGIGVMLTLIGTVCLLLTIGAMRS